MKVYIDTNVLVAASIPVHPHHVPAFDLVSTVKRGIFVGCIGTHGLAEYYSVLTRAPYTPRVLPDEAESLLEENVFPLFEVVPLTTDDYRSVIRNAANRGFKGGMIFDALHLCAAMKAGCERVYTFNVKHFRALASKELEGKITAP